ncbi:hypothetical protein HYX70_04605 [Candidatus Saccharibacteria bacterium]|nr:hypothetical protein [Candidatus Saccharibacteria bacterium]
MVGPESQPLTNENQPVRVESGHFYGPENVTDGYDVHDPQGKSNAAERKVRNERIEQGLELGREVEDLLIRHNFAVERILFHDDIDVKIEQSKSVDSWRWQLFINRAVMTALDRTKLSSSSPVKLEEESKYVDPARELIEELKKAAEMKDGWRISEGGKKLIVGSGPNRQRIDMVGFLEHDELPSCEVLDMVAYRKKIWGSKGTVTVLPESYKGQQDRVKRLFELFDEAAPVVVVYHDDKGRPVDIDEWSPQYTQEVGAIIKQGLENDID